MEEKLQCDIKFSPNRKYCKDFENIDLWGGKRSDNSAYTSLTSAYYSIFSESLYHEYNNILVFEDDIKFENDYGRKIVEFMQNVPNDWCFLNLGYHESKNIPHGWKVFYLNSYISRVDVSWTTHSVAFRGKEIFQKLLNRMDNNAGSIEHILNYFTHIEKNNASYTPNEMIFTQLSDRNYDCDDKKFKSLIT
jgi:GR25 family glycosyltransferase involved in LPS biosynthesis